MKAKLEITLEDANEEAIQDLIQRITNFFVKAQIIAEIDTPQDVRSIEEVKNSLAHLTLER